MSDITLDPAWGEDVGTPMSDNDALRLLITRIKPSDLTVSAIQGDVGEGWDAPGPIFDKLDMSEVSRGIGNWVTGRNDIPLAKKVALATAMLKNLPPEMRTEKILTSGDLRPMLAAVYRDEDIPEGTKSFAINYFTDENTRIKKGYSEYFGTQSATTTDATGTIQRVAGNYEDIVEEKLQSARDGTITMLPDFKSLNNMYLTTEGDVQTGNEQLDDDIAGFMDIVSGSGAKTKLSFMTEQEAQQLFTYSDDVSGEVNATLGLEQQYMDARDAGEATVTGSRLGINYDDEQQTRHYGLAPGVGGNTEMKRQDVTSTKTYTLTETLNMPQGMTRQQILDMSKKLEEAGFYELVGGKPIHKGSASDPKFKAAWKKLVGMSVEEGESMTSLLESRREAYQDAIEESLSASLTDPARIRINAEQLGRNIIGRKLTGEEQSALTTFVHDLERRNARLDAGLSLDGSVDDETGLDVNIMADIDAQMAEYVERNNPVEAGAKEYADMGDTFSRLLAGPGRGGAF